MSFGQIHKHTRLIGPFLVRIGTRVTKKKKENTNIYAIHLVFGRQNDRDLCDESA